MKVVLPEKLLKPRKLNISNSVNTTSLPTNSKTNLQESEKILNHEDSISATHLNSSFVSLASLNQSTSHNRKSSGKSLKQRFQSKYEETYGKIDHIPKTLKKTKTDINIQSRFYYRLESKFNEIRNLYKQEGLTEKVFEAYQLAFMDIICTDQTNGTFLAEVKDVYEKWIENQKKEIEKVEMMKRKNEHLKNVIHEKFQEINLMNKKVKLLSKENLDLGLKIKTLNEDYERVLGC